MTPSQTSPAVRLLAALAVIVALWWGQRFLVPLSAGLMLAVLVNPVAEPLGRWLRSRVAATVLSLAMVMGALVAAATAFGGQLVSVAERAPEMISMVAQQLAERDTRSDSVLTRSRLALQELDRAAERLMADKPLVRPGRRAPAAAPAAVAASAPANTITAGATVALRETAASGSNVLLGFAGYLAIIFFVAFFVLSGGPALNARFIDLWSDDGDGRERAHRATLESARQIRIYGGVLLVTNTVIGVVVWIGFMLVGLPDAAGWGVTAAVLHVVPYLGMALLTVLGAAEAFLVHGTLGAALGVAAFVVALSTVVGTLVTAWLHGRAAKMNAAAVFIGLMFWGALWGAWGLFLGPPLVVVLKVVAEHSLTGQRWATLMKG